MSSIDFLRGIRRFRSAPLSVVLLAAIHCNSSGSGEMNSPDGARDLSMTETGDGAVLNSSYKATVVPLACDDLSSAEILALGATSHVTMYRNLPFPFPLFATNATRFVVAEPGHIYIGGADLFVSTAGEPQQPPNATIPNGWVAPFWDRQFTYVRNVRGDVRVLRTGSGADERFVIGYQDFTLAFPLMVPNPDVHLSIQVALLRQSQAIELRYCRLDPGPNPTQELRDRVLGGSASIGLEANDGSLGISYSYMTPLKQAGLAIRFTPTP